MNSNGAAKMGRCRRYECDISLDIVLKMWFLISDLESLEMDKFQL